MPDNRDIVFVIIPYYNESTVIAGVVNSLSGHGYQLVLVDDGSAIKPDTLVHNTQNLFLLHHKVNLGQGAAIQTGIDFALTRQARFLITFDGDGQHFAEDLPAMLEPLYNNEADITLASRFLEKGSHNASGSRRLVLKLGRFINYVFSGLYLTDAHNGLRAMTRDAAQKIRLKENRMAHASEVLFQIRQHRLRYKEVPARVAYTAYSKRKGQSVFNSIRIFFDLVLHKLFE